MKKLILMLAVFFLSLSVSKAQSYVFGPDSVKNAVPTYQLAPAVSGKYPQINFEFTVNKVSGTVAGSCRVEVSDSGVDWAKHPTADTLLLSNVAKSYKLVSIPDSATAYRLYRVRCLGSGTMAALVNTRVTLFSKK